MSFKEKLKKFVGIKTVEELNKTRTKKEKIKDFFESLFFAGIAALFIITFIVQNTRIPTTSMVGTILVGDFVLVNKFIFGSSSPKYIPFTEIELPYYFTLPSVREPEEGDIVVFEYPGHKDQLRPDERLPHLMLPEEFYNLNVNYVKRLIGLPGDTIEIRDKVVYINGKEAPIPPYVRYYDEELSRVAAYPDVYKPFPAGQRDPNIFPSGKDWNQDNYGPLYIPKKGDVVELNIDNIEQWRTIIDREFMSRVVTVRDSVIYINGEPKTSYTLKKDYFFMLGDNRDVSLDSRFWGFISRDMIVGQAFMVLFSWDRDIPFSDFFRLISSIRPERILKLLE